MLLALVLAHLNCKRFVFDKCLGCHVRLATRSWEKVAAWYALAHEEADPAFADIAWVGNSEVDFERHLVLDRTFDCFDSVGHVHHVIAFGLVFASMMAVWIDKHPFDLGVLGHHVL